MDQSTLKMAMSGFSHDIGKIVDMGVLKMPPGYFDDNAGVFLPVYNGKYSHWHALYTAAFIESQGDLLPVELSQKEWGDGSSFIRLAAAHHAPSSPMEEIVALADRISSGMDRETFQSRENDTIYFKDFKKTRLLPIFSHISLENDIPMEKSQQFPFRYPLGELTPESIFPVEAAAITPKNANQAKEDYASVFKDFLKGLAKLGHLNVDPALWFEHFDSLTMRFASSVPAARTGDIIHDVSLYDHMATTSALSTAIYLYHRDNNTLDSSHIHNRDEKKFLMVSGDFYGIQNFIFNGYGDTRKYRSKLLRGRSFAVSLLVELASDMLCREIGLPHTSVILNAGGRFSILAPNTPATVAAVASVKARINQWMVRRTYGETCIGMAVVEASCRDFEPTSFADFWLHMVLALDREKKSRMELDVHGGAVAHEEYLDQFSNELSPGICPLCGKRPAHVANQLGELHTCSMCLDHVFLGKNLVKNAEIAICDVNTSMKGNKLTDPIFGKYQLFFPSEENAEKTYKNGNTRDLKILKYWQLGLKYIEDSDALFTAKFMNGHIPFYAHDDVGEDVEPGMPKTLNDIAGASVYHSGTGNKQGTKALGVLKADVDNLGRIMACGLRENLYTISRVATMSRQMNNFFALYLPDFLENTPQFNDVYTVFAGGDDLFLMGPWNHIIVLVDVLEERFAAYVAGNDEIHFSAGIVVDKSHTPIDRLAEASESALEHSKHSGRDRVTLFDRTVTWADFKALKTVEKELASWLDNDWISDVLFYKLNHFIDMAEEEHRILRKNSGAIHLDDMACTKWRALLTYTVERNVALRLKDNQRRDKVKYISGKAAQLLDQYRGDLRIPLWTIQYNRR